MMSVRKNIHEGAKQFFGEEIKISDRVFQSFEVTSRASTIPHIEHVWASMTKVFPAILQVYDKLGIDYDVMRKSMPKDIPSYDPDIHDFKSDDWEIAFSKIFSSTQLRDGKTLTPTANKIKTEKSLNLDTLFEGIVTLTKQSTLINRTRSPRKMTNLILRLLFVGAGLERVRTHGEASEEFTEKIINTFNQIRQQDVSYSDQQFIFYYDKDTIRISPFGFFDTSRLNNDEGSVKLFLARSNLVQRSYPFSPDSIAELEDLINKNALERDFQNFFEKNPKYLITLGDYGNIHSQLILHEDNGTTLIPDFFLEKINSDFCDIVDLKRAQKDLIRTQTNRIRFKDAIMEGVAQLRTYRDFFEERYNRQKFKDTYGLTAYRPRVVLIIGRKQSYFDEVESIRLQSSLPDWLTLKTYDDLVDKAKLWNSFG